MTTEPSTQPDPMAARAARFSDLLGRLGARSSTESTVESDRLVGRLQDEIGGLLAEFAVVRSRAAEFHAAVLEAPVALVVFGSDSIEELARSRFADALLRGGAAAALDERRFRQLVDRATHGTECHEIIDSIGPPRRTFAITAMPIETPPDTPRPNRCGVVVHIEDTTAWRRAELARRDLVTNLSHELRTPVGAVALLAETIASEDDPETIRRLASRLEHEAQRLAQTLEDALALGRLEAAATIDRRDVDLSELAHFCAARVRPLAEVNGIEVLTDDVISDVHVKGDRSLLQTAITNLLDNAIKYTDVPAPIRIGLRRLDESDGCYAELTVKDSGVGIPMRERQRIFERFYRVDRARSRDTGGSGLGLAIVRHVAVNHDGDVTVESIEGEGATFTVRIPCMTSPSQESRATDG